MEAPAFMCQFMAFFEGTVSKPCLDKLAMIFTARIMTIGKCTISNLARVAGENPYRCSWHHVFSRYKIDLWPLSFKLFEMIVQKLVKNETVILSVDDTTCLHKGRRVFGKGTHRDGVRSSRGIYIPVVGHKWVVVCINVTIPKSIRTWALPVAVGLCRSSEESQSTGRTHKSPAQIARKLIGKIRINFPNLKFVVVGDQGFGQHETAKDLSSSKSALVAKFYPKAALHGDLSKRIENT